MNVRLTPEAEADLLLYYLDAEDAVVFGCFHTARDPKAWQERSDVMLD